MAEVLDCFHNEKECVLAFIHTYECFGVVLDKVVNTGVFFQTNDFVEYISVRGIENERRRLRIIKEVRSGH